MKWQTEKDRTVIADLRQPPYPDIMSMNSCIWDICLVSFDETKLKEILAQYNAHDSK